MSLRALVNPFHAYCFGTSFWYLLRGTVRAIDPATVCGWFRPPAQGGIDPNDLELYTTRVDAWGLLALSAILLVISDAVPLPKSMTGSSLTDSSVSITAKKPYAKAVIVITMLHHFATGCGSYQHWKLPTHRTVAMDIGVWGNVGLFALGIAALAYIGKEREVPEVVGGRKKRA
ncbi:uncharacterized protein RCC_06446 [Ramularia collo-cygni]|uniref:Uncharacterized protein n=1 Tax=Ramularia collo-cygni TaxID=112498 RepID=A0A2D3UYN8_9PEZI|nr:uncharacterized protein RCC_06446 [Ramularia collo-cygni]CZT20588.1 uncharacterized protein RCC_06446 [Ramularia collo-cygni]